MDLLAEQLRKARVECWAYCLMPNHVHLILRPTTAEGLALALGSVHRRWANFVNARGRWRGHLFDGRFASVAMDKDHLMAAVRYVALNPVRARLTAKAQDWPWSSVAAHLAGEGDGVVSVQPVLERTESFRALIDGDADDPAFGALRAAETTGRPLGNAAFIAGLERVLGRPVARSPAERLAESQTRAPTTSSHCFEEMGNSAPVPVFLYS